MAKKKRILDKIVSRAFPIVGIIFMVTLFAIFWSYILLYKWIVLGVSGGIIILFGLMGYFNKKKFMRGFKRRYK